MRWRRSASGDQIRSGALAACHLQGFVAEAAAGAAIGSGLVAMVTNNPRQHLQLFHDLSVFTNGVLTPAAVGSSQLVAPPLDGGAMFNATIVDFPDDLPPQVSIGDSFRSRRSRRRDRSAS